MEKTLVINGVELPCTINEYGVIFNKRTNREQYQDLNKGKMGIYKRVKVEYNRKKYRQYTHILVAQHFLPPPPPLPNLKVNHHDGDTMNNHVSNLYWTTHSENMKHYYDVLKPKGIKKKRIDHRRIYEEGLGVKIKPGNHVHHIDWDHLNDVLDNLMEVTHKEHVWLHEHNNEYLKTYNRDQIREIINREYHGL